MDQAKDNFMTAAGSAKTIGSSPESKNALTRAGKSFWAGLKRLNKRVGAAEARLILRVFYLTVIGVASLALRSGRRKAMEAEERSEVAWTPRVSPGTDPTKQY